MDIFVQLSTDKPGQNPITLAVKQVLKALAEVTFVDQLVDDDENEADMAIVGDASRALRYLKETERTVVVLTYLSKEDRRTAEAMAERNPRIKAMCYVEPLGEPNFVEKLLKLIAEKRKEIS